MQRALIADKSFPLQQQSNQGTTRRIWSERDCHARRMSSLPLTDSLKPLYHRYIFLVYFL